MIAVAALAFAAYAGTLELGDRTEMRVRATEGQPVGYDAVTIPSARAVVTDRRWTYNAAYAPTLILQDLQTQLDPVVLHSGTVGAAWHDRLARLTLREDATYGKQNTANLALTSTGGAADARPQPLQGLPAPTTITTASSRTTLGTEVRPARRWIAGASVGYNLAGGADEASRAAIPQQRGPFGDASLGYTLSRTDLFSGVLTVAKTDVTSGPCLAQQAAAGAPAVPTTICAPANETAVATVGLRHVFSRHVDGALSAGLSGARTRLHAEDPFVSKVYPAGSLSLGYREGLGRRVTTLRLDAQLAPIVDLRTGVADDRAQVTGTVSWRRGDLTLSGSGGAARSFGNAFVRPGTFVSVGPEAQYDVGKHASFSAGIRYFWQTQGDFDALSSAIGFVGLTVRSAALRF